MHAHQEFLQTANAVVLEASLVSFGCFEDEPSWVCIGSGFFFCFSIASVRYLSIRMLLPPFNVSSDKRTLAQVFHCCRLCRC